MIKRSLFNMTLALFASMSFLSCGDDDKQEPYTETVEANAKGLYVMWQDNNVKTEDTYFWINDYVVKRYYDSPTIAIENLNLSLHYQSFNSMEPIYAELSDYFGRTIDETTDLSSLKPDPTAFVNKMQTLKSKYSFIMIEYGEVYVFNRVSNKNYE